MKKRQIFTVPLSFKAHWMAEQRRQQQIHPQKAKQSYLNTLAVFAVNEWLNCLEFKTDWEASDCHNSLIMRFMDVADLMVNRIGKLECRPVLPGSDFCEIPLEAREDRIGYVAVQLDQSLKYAEILGFVSTPAEVIPLDQLRSPEELISYLSRQAKPGVTLHQWLEGFIEQGWQTTERLLYPEQLALTLHFRRQMEVSRGQRIDLGMDLGSQSVALVLTVSAETETQLDIGVQVHPIGQIYLSPGVELTVTDESGTCLEVLSREADNFIQKEFIAGIGDQFSVTVATGEVRVTKDFTV